MTAEHWPSLHFLFSDLTGISVGFALFSLLALVPGYAIGWLTNVFGFRTRSFPFRLGASVPISLSVVPIVGYTAGRWFSLDRVWLVYAALAVITIFAGALRRTSRPAAAFDKPIVWTVGVAASVWIAIAMLSLADLPLGHRLYFSIIDFDYSVRTAFIHSISAFGLPARNPFYFPGHAAGLRYHYLWMIACAQIYRIGSPLVDARSALIAGTMWVGIALIALIPMYLRLFLSASSDLLRRSRIGIALLAVTGLDIVPALLMVWLQRAGLVSGISPSVEWWNEQVDGWLYTLLWEPHYVCSLVACLTGFLIVWNLPTAASRPQRIVFGVLAGTAFATASGCGIYVAIVFAVFLGIWFAVILVEKRWGEAETLAIAGVTGAVLIRPFFTALADSLASGAGPAPHLFELTIRAFAPVEILFGPNRIWQHYAANLLLLPLNYFIELGVFFVAGWIWWIRFKARQRPATRAELAGILMAATSIMICTFVKSTAIANNDLGWRGFLPAQFMLLLCAAGILSERTARSRLIGLMLIVGLAGVIYDLAILRFYPLLSDLGKMPKISWLGADERVGLRTFATREAYEWLRARTSEVSILQPNPSPTYQDTFFYAYGQRQAVAVGGDCGAGFGGAQDKCASFMAVLGPLFTGGGTQRVTDACTKLPIDVIIAQDTDVAWRDSSSWVWTATPIYHNDFVRAFTCHPNSRR